MILTDVPSFALVAYLKKRYVALKIVNKLTSFFSVDYEDEQAYGSGQIAMRTTTIKPKKPMKPTDIKRKKQCLIYCI